MFSVMVVLLVSLVVIPTVSSVFQVVHRHLDQILTIVLTRLVWAIFVIAVLVLASLV